MNRLRTHYHTRPDLRAGELDPSTFDYPEQFQMTPRDYRLRAWVWRGIFAWCAAFVAGVAWLIF